MFIFIPCLCVSMWVYLYIHNIEHNLWMDCTPPPTCSFKGPGPRRQGPQTPGILSAGEDAPVYYGSVCWSAQFLHLLPGWEDLPWSFVSAGLIPGLSPGWVEDKGQHKSSCLQSHVYRTFMASTHIVWDKTIYAFWRLKTMILEYLNAHTYLKPSKWKCTRKAARKTASLYVNNTWFKIYSKKLSLQMFSEEGNAFNTVMNTHNAF